MSEKGKVATEKGSNENENSTLDDDITNKKADSVANVANTSENTVNPANSAPNVAKTAIADAGDNADNNSNEVTDTTNTTANVTNIDASDNANSTFDSKETSGIADDTIASSTPDTIADSANSTDATTDITNSKIVPSENKIVEADEIHASTSDSSSDNKGADPNSADVAKKDKATIKKKTDTTPSTDEDIDPDLPNAKPMTLMQHLGELRNIIVRSAIIISLAFVVCYGFADLIFAELMVPLTKVLPPGSKLIFTSLPEAFFLELQIGFVAAIFMASPFLFYQIWSFIAPGLYDEEKKYAIPIAIISAFFFICGASFCYYVVFPFSFEYFMSFATDDIVPMPSISQYFSFTLKILIAFGLIFEMPLFTFFLSRMGLVTATAMRNVRKYAILVIFIVAAILTPPDVISQLLMAIPMIFLYEISIYIAVIFGRKPKKKEDADDEDDESQAETK